MGTSTIRRVLPNFIFTNHHDNNSNSIYRSKKGIETVVDMFGMFIEKGIIDYDYESNRVEWNNSEVEWNNSEREIRLGAFNNRLGVDG